MILLGFGLSTSFAFSPVRAAEYRQYSGCCDASAAVAISDTLFAAASDEENTVRIFSREVAGPPVDTIKLSSFLAVRPKEEADLEGGARVGDTVYWIGSHSRNSRGELHTSRHVLFGMAIQGTGTSVTLSPKGTPYRGLARALGEEPKLAPFDFRSGAAKPGEAPGGLNIEGLAAGPDGSLWIGFRNPVPDGQAVIVPILNPAEVIAGRKIAFGDPVRVNLGGLGIRDIARAGAGYLIIAGPGEGGGKHRLFSWSGDSKPPQELQGAIPRGFQAEGIAIFESDKSAEVLGDDASRKANGKRCEDLPRGLERTFRALRVGW